jgi:hypothetical protein
MRKLLIAIVALLALGVGIWWLVGRDLPQTAPGADVAIALDPDAPLAFVPADTPYLIANLERMPKATVDAFVQQSEPALQIWRTQFDLLSRRVDDSEAIRPAAKWLRAIDAEFRGKSLEQSMHSVGLDLQSLSAVYGVGLVPVARLTLADPDAFRAFIARLEERSGETIPSASVDGVAFWQFAAADTPLRGIMALQGNHLVLTVAPIGDDQALRVLLGIERPTATLHDGGELAAINRKYGFSPYATGYVDSARLLALLAAPATPLESAFLSALEIEKPAIDAICQSEFAALAALVPRLVLGYTRLEPKSSHGVTRIELRPDVAQDLMRLRAPMPGLDAAQDAVVNFGLSLRVGEVPALLGKWSGALAAAPWQCAALTPLNESAAEVSAQAANPAVFMAAPVFHGFHAILNRIDLSTIDTAPDLSGVLVIGSPSPAALLAMARNFVPALAQLKLEPNGQVQALPPMPGLPSHLPAHVAMNEQLLGIAFGAGQDAGLGAAMQSDPTRQPLLVLGYSGALISQFTEKMAQTTAAIADPEERAEAEQSMQAMRSMYALIGRIEMTVELDPDGIAIHQSATMR